MNNSSTECFTPANYRVRLYLSIDLSGSTAYKNSTSGTIIDIGVTPKWVTEFQHFYSNFPRRLDTEFQNTTSASIDKEPGPKLWKAVGDELIFCKVISNKTSCLQSITAFIRALHNYREYLNRQQISLDVKGAGWVAAFPEPNRTICLINQEYEPNSESLDKAAEQDPFQYDFLGKAIDTGFRVASNATPEKFALSVQLARLLVETDEDDSFSHNIQLEPPKILKGVNNNKPYPMLYIRTEKHLSSGKVSELERNALKIEDTKKSNLKDYLNEYCRFVGTDDITFDKSSKKLIPPKSYEDFKTKMSKHYETIVDQEYKPTLEESNVQPNEDISSPESFNLEPLADANAD